MTPKKLIFGTIAFIGIFCSCKEKAAPKASKNGAVQVLTQPVSSITGSWTGAFESDKEEYFVDKETGDTLPATPNKITLFISQLEYGNIKGFSVCAGNERPFTGSYEEENGKINAS